MSPRLRRRSGARTRSRESSSQGHQRGRQLGYPTANVPVVNAETQFPPTASMPAGCADSTNRARRTCQQRSPSAPTRPSATIARTVESYVLDRTDLELYGVRGRSVVPRPVARSGQVRLRRRPSGPDEVRCRCRPRRCWPHLRRDRGGEAAGGSRPPRSGSRPMGCRTSSRPMKAESLAALRRPVLIPLVGDRAAGRRWRGVVRRARARRRLRRDRARRCRLRPGAARVCVGVAALPADHDAGRSSRHSAACRWLFPLVTRALPLLLLFMTFLFINTEVWQVTSALERGLLWLTVMLFAGIAIAFLLVRLPEEVRDVSQRRAGRAAGRHLRRDTIG